MLTQQIVEDLQHVLCFPKGAREHILDIYKLHLGLWELRQSKMLRWVMMNIFAYSARMLLEIQFNMTTGEFNRL